MAEKLVAIRDWAGRRARPASSKQAIKAAELKKGRKLEV